MLLVVKRKNTTYTNTMNTNKSNKQRAEEVLEAALTEEQSSRAGVLLSIADRYIQLAQIDIHIELNTE